jgi:hypothetical protein
MSTGTASTLATAIWRGDDMETIPSKSSTKCRTKDMTSARFIWRYEPCSGSDTSPRFLNPAEEIRAMTPITVP